jgi:hypothetical protein
LSQPISPPTTGVLVQQGAGIEVILVKIDPLAPAQVAAAVKADRLPAGQARVAKVQGPAQVAVARRPSAPWKS